MINYECIKNTFIIIKFKNIQNMESTYSKKKYLILFSNTIQIISKLKVPFEIILINIMIYIILFY